MSRDSVLAPLPPTSTGLRCRCPRCGQGKLFNGFLTLKPKCDACGLDYSFADPGDGPAFFIMIFGCIPGIALAVWMETSFQPPFWVHLLISLPVLLITCLLPMRPLKGLMVASQYVHKAGLGKLDRDQADGPPA